MSRINRRLGKQQIVHGERDFVRLDSFAKVLRCVTQIITPMNEKDKSGPFQGYERETMRVVYESRNEQTASASGGNETRRLNEPVIFRFRDFKFAQRRRRVVIYDAVHRVVR